MSRGQDAAIEVHALAKVFGAATRHPVRAVQGIDFEVHSGEVFGLLGLNGAGKTTALRMLATLFLPTAGSARVAGHDVVAAPAEVRRRIGFLSGDTRLYDRLTATELLVYFGRLDGLGAAAARERAGELIGRFGLAGAADRRVGRLSTGLKQRVNLARAWIHDPPILILDEPSAGLDVLGAREVGAAIAGARAEGRCVLYSTHSIGDAARLCDRVAILHQGRLLAAGTPAAVAAGHEDLAEAFAALVGTAGGEVERRAS